MADKGNGASASDKFEKVDKDGLGRDILAIYTRNSLGKVLKKEIDTIVFHHILKGTLSGEYVDGDRIKYLHIDKREIFRLARQLRTSEASIRKSIEEDCYYHFEDLDARGFFAHLAEKGYFKSDDYDDKKDLLRIFLPNPLAKRYLEERICKVGGIPEYGTSGDILLIRLEHLLEILRDEKGGDLYKEIYKTMREHNARSGDQDVAAFLAGVNAPTLKGNVKEFLSGVKSKLKGEQQSMLVKAIIAGVLSFLKLSAG